MKKKKRKRFLINGVEFAGSIIIMFILLSFSILDPYILIIVIILVSIFMAEILYTIYLLVYKYSVSISKNAIQLPRQRLSHHEVIIKINELSHVIKNHTVLIFVNKNNINFDFDLDDLDQPKKFLQILMELLIKNQIPLHECCRAGHLSPPFLKYSQRRFKGGDI